jgi:hypothetical protein
MDTLIKNAPSIIEASAKSQLGILALAILTAAAIAYLWFRHEHVAIRIVVYSMMVAGVFIYGFAVTGIPPPVPHPPNPDHSVVPKPPPVIDYSGRVIDNETGSWIRGAQVVVDIPGVSEVYTDSEGEYTIQTSSVFTKMQVHVRADGYEPYDRNLSLESIKEFHNIRLTRIKPKEPHQKKPKSVAEQVPAVKIAGIIVDAKTSARIDRAAVTLQVDGAESITKYTDSQGSYSFDVHPEASGQIWVTADDYEPFHLHFSARNRNQLSDIRLSRNPKP